MADRLRRVLRLGEGRYLSNFACLQLRLKEGEDISGTLVIFQSLAVLTRQIETLTEILVRLGLGQINRVERFVSAVIQNHTSAPPFLWQYSAISLTIDEKDCVCT